MILLVTSENTQETQTPPIQFYFVTPQESYLTTEVFYFHPSVIQALYSDNYSDNRLCSDVYTFLLIHIFQII